MLSTLRILLGPCADFELRFRILKNPIAELWVERMLLRTAWPMDHPDRFYGFGSQSQEQQRGQEMIQRCIDTINAHEPIIDRPFEYTQDCLNYLHNIFERYHGLLDQQNTDYWHSAPVVVRQALSELNLAVHRCENAMRKIYPRLVCTWFGMPKTHRLDPNLQQVCGTSEIKFGTVYLNYCEIGKTVEDLEADNDQYIGDDAFRPFSHYSADFNVQFYDRDLRTKYGRIQHYIDQHQDFFIAHDIKSVYNVKAQPLRFPVAELEYAGDRKHLLANITSRQWVYQVLIE
jgi:hypothetical protein